MAIEIYYYYNENKSLTLLYYDSLNNKIKETYYFYSLKQAIRIFRNRYKLRNKKLNIIKL